MWLTVILLPVTVYGLCLLPTVGGAHFQTRQECGASQATPGHVLFWLAWALGCAVELSEWCLMVLLTCGYAGSSESV